MAKPVLFIIPGACSFGSLALLEALDIKYKVGITTPEIRAGEQFAKINPARKVGALKDGDHVIAENTAILLSLVDKYDLGNKLCPSVKNVKRQKVYQWLSYLSTTYHPTYGQMKYAERYIDNKAAATRLADSAYERFVNILDFINSYLLENKYFTWKERPSVVDYQAYGLLRWTVAYERTSELFANDGLSGIKSFLERMEADGNVRNALRVEKEEVAKLRHSKFAGYFNFVEAEDAK